MKLSTNTELERAVLPRRRQGLGREFGDPVGAGVDGEELEVVGGAEVVVVAQVVNLVRAHVQPLQVMRTVTFGVQLRNRTHFSRP